MTITLVALVFLLLGVTLGTLTARAKSASLAASLSAKNAELAARSQELSSSRKEAEERGREKTAAETEVVRLTERLAQERVGAAEKLELLTKAGQELQDAFQRLATDALANNNQRFLDLAKMRLEADQKQALSELEKREQAVATLVAPIAESLGKVEEQVKSIEKDRISAYSSLREQLVSLTGSQEQLKSETGKLVQALRQPHVRGRWGEIQLRRVVELAGMLNYCDFLEQLSVATSDGRLRPDMVVRLPGGQQIIVDSKVPLSAYLEATEATDEETRRLRMMAHATQVKDHMAKLGAKSYWEQFESTPEFVVMFLPGEVFFSAALEQMPSLIESGVEQKVIPASPTTLIALLRAVFYGWQQMQLAENAQKISDLGKKVYDSLRVMGGHMEDLGGYLEKSLRSYNRTIGSIERNVFANARRFPELGIGTEGAIKELEQREETARLLQSPDWVIEQSNAAKV